MPGLAWIGTVIGGGKERDGMEGRQQLGGWRLQQRWFGGDWLAWMRWARSAGSGRRPAGTRAGRILQSLPSSRRCSPPAVALRACSGPAAAERTPAGCWPHLRNWLQRRLPRLARRAHNGRYLRLRLRRPAAVQGRVHALHSVAQRAHRYRGRLPGQAGPRREIQSGPQVAPRSRRHRPRDREPRPQGAREGRMASRTRRPPASGAACAADPPGTRDAG